MSNPTTVLSSASGSNPEIAAAKSATLARGLRSSKIHDEHLERLAIVYVRQSSPQQVVEHPESRARQYALADHAQFLGWPKEQVQVIDEDQGQSGRSAEPRTGFQRLLSEVTLDHVGIILGLEMSRLARSSKDWHNLLELCALVGTLLADQDGIYNPTDSNDRLLLGLKGAMSEFELFTMRNRLQRGLLNKAQRGEVYFMVPCGYLKLASREVVQEPDEQARAVVQLVFDKFSELGSRRRVFRYLLDKHIDLGMRVQYGARRGDLVWRRPTLETLTLMFHHPIYAGAYSFGRRPLERKRSAGGGMQVHRRWLRPEEWKVLKRDHLPAYITWERYLANLEQLERNRPQHHGVPRQGAALLSGLVVCGRCGYRRQTSYQRVDYAAYNCRRYRDKTGKNTCAGMKAAVLDELVAQQVFCALQPAALQLSVRALQEIHQERERLHEHWQKRLVRARYESERAERQYQLVEPENRLVARTLEQRWEESLRAGRRLQDEYERFTREQPLSLTAADHARISALSQDIAALWQAPGTSNTDRKEIVRCLVERVVVHVRADSEHVDVAIHWKGGFTSQHEIIRPVGKYQSMQHCDQLLQRIVQLRHEGQTAAEIADKLNQEKLTPPRRGLFRAELVRQLLSRQGLGDEKCRAQLGPHEWWLPQLARELAMSPFKLRTWMIRGWLHCRQTPAQHLWIAWADRDELRRLRKLKGRWQKGLVTHPPALTTPKKKTAP